MNPARCSDASNASLLLLVLRETEANSVVLPVAPQVVNPVTPKVIRLGESCRRPHGKGEVCYGVRTAD